MGFRSRQNYVAVFGLVVVSCLCFLSLTLLPTGDEISLKSKVSIRDALNRPYARINDQKILMEKMSKAEIAAPPIPPPLFFPDKRIIQKGVTAELNEERRTFIKSMTKHAWEGYRKYAWGSNELRPVSRTRHSASIFGSGDLGATIVDAVDTLYIMNLTEYYEEGRLWINRSLDIRNAIGDLSVFETNIRFIGGLLSAFALTNDRMYMKKASEIADLLLPAFNTPTGIPNTRLNLATNVSYNLGWASGGCSILSEIGSLHIEFEYLSKVTKNPIYSEKVMRIREVLSSVEKPEGLYPNYINPKTGKWGKKHVSIGALGDSFYEYLLKSWLLSNKKDEQAKIIYDEAINAMKKRLLRYSELSHLAYFAELDGLHLKHKMDHLACFIVGMFALEAMNENNSNKRSDILTLAEELGNTCHESYIRTKTGIGPESFRFYGEEEAVTKVKEEKYYILRPEVIEGWFYLWRATHNPKYREWCWNAALAIEKHCRTPNGYSGIRNVYEEQASWDDVQQSFIFSETFKYLYLVFSEDDLISLDKWVFNTEAHPFPIFI